MRDTTKRFPRVSKLSGSYTSAGSGPHRRKTWFSRLWPWAVGIFIFLLVGKAVSEIIRAASVARATYASFSLAQEKRSAEFAILTDCRALKGEALIVNGECNGRRE